MSREIADHLRYFAAMGVTGMSRDPAWRARASEKEAGSFSGEKEPASFSEARARHAGSRLMPVTPMAA